MVTAKPRWTLRRMLIRSGKTPWPATLDLQKTIPRTAPCSLLGTRSRGDSAKPMACSCTSGQRRVTTLWLGSDRAGDLVTESQLAILKAAECAPDTPALPRMENHHSLVASAVQHIAEEEKTLGGALGRPSGARFRTYERLKRYATDLKGTLFDTAELQRAIEEIYRYPLQQWAVDCSTANSEPAPGRNARATRLSASGSGPPLRDLRRGRDSRAENYLLPGPGPGSDSRIAYAA